MHESDHSSQSATPSINVHSTESTNVHSPPLTSDLTAARTEQVPTSVQQLVKQLPNLISKEIGTYLDGQHKIQLTADAVPMAVKMRPIPYVI